jgi:hypothetical protein
MHKGRRWNTYSFCIALTTALENGAELVFALMVAGKERLSVERNMQSHKSSQWSRT